MNKQKVFVKYWFMQFKSIVEIKNTFVRFTVSTQCPTVVQLLFYAEMRIKLIISEFLSARADCDGRRQSVHLFSVKGREQGRPDVTLKSIVNNNDD